MLSFRALAVALFAGVLVVPTAHASFPSSIETTVAPGGSSTIGSPSLDPSMRSATVDVAPAESEDAALFRNMQLVLSLQPTPGKRLLTCVSLYTAVQDPDDDMAMLFPEEAQPLAILLLSACLHMAAEVNRAAQQAQQSAMSAAARCQKAATQIGATFTRVGKKYKATIEGTPTKLQPRAGASRLRVSCRRKGNGLSLHVRPTAKGTSLRSVVGPRLRVGAYNPLESTGSARLKVTFRR